MKPRGRFTLKSSIALAAAGGLGLALAVAVIAGWLYWQEQKTEFGLSFLATSRAITASVDRELEQAVGLARGLSLSRCLADDDMACFDTQARQLLAPYGYSAILNPADSTRRLVNTQLEPGSPMPEFPPDPDWIEPEAKAGNIAVKPLAPSRVWPGVWLTIVQAPVMDGGAPRYFVNILVPTTVIQRVIDEQQFPADWAAVVFDSDWTIAARLWDPKQFVGRKGASRQLRDAPELDKVYESRYLEGDWGLSSYSRSKRYGWTTSVGMRQADIFWQVVKPVSAVAAGGFLAVAVTMIGLAIFVFRLARSIAALSAGMKALGKADALELPPFRLAELAEMSDGMQAVNADLREHARHLEAAVAEAKTQLGREMEERRQAEAALAQSQKMEALGQLTGGMAHDFNNMLTAMSAGISILQRRIHPMQPELERYLSMMKSSAERASGLVRGLLAFARRQALEPQPADVNKLVAGMTEMLAGSLGENVEIETVRASGLWQVSVDRNLLESALLNLAINARDAMPEGGKLTIETANAFLDESYAERNEEVRPGRYVMIAISDTGTGMSPEVVTKAIEPFFTTKPPGTGTGLGLSQVHGFIKQSGGHLKIYSEPGQGTTVKIYLPWLSGGAAAEPAAEPRGSIMPGKETILVVEDDEDVRAFTTEILDELGYLVLMAGDGPEALAVLEREVDISLLFTDVVLPKGLNGRQLAEEAARRRPGLKVLYTSGYSRNAIFHHGRLDPGIELISKPFTDAELGRKVRQVLDGDGA